MRRSKWVIHAIGIFNISHALVGWRKQNTIIAPVDINLRAPDIFTTESESKGIQPHRIVSNCARQNDQVSPGQCVSVFFLDWPQQTAGLV